MDNGSQIDVEEIASTPSNGQGAVDLASLHSCYDIYNIHFTSHRKILGWPIIFAKKLLRRLLTPILERQLTYNTANTHLVSALWRHGDTLQTVTHGDGRAAGARYRRYGWRWPGSRRPRYRRCGRRWPGSRRPRYRRCGRRWPSSKEAALQTLRTEMAEQKEAALQTLRTEMAEQQEAALQTLRTEMAEQQEAACSATDVANGDGRAD